MTQSSTSQRTLNYKLVLLGDAAVGKSSIAERFVRNEFFDYQQPTIGAAFLTQTIQLDNNVNIKFEIWDTAGQERYRSLAPMYYRGASAALIVFDITNNESFNGAKTWCDELQRQANNNIIIALAGNKIDLENNRQVSYEQANNYAQQNNLIYYETSARSGNNIRELFTDIAKKLPQQQKQKNRSGQLSLTQRADDTSTNSCCSG